MDLFIAYFSFKVPNHRKWNWKKDNKEKNQVQVLIFEEYKFKLFQNACNLLFISLPSFSTYFAVNVPVLHEFMAQT